MAHVEEGKAQAEIKAKTEVNNTSPGTNTNTNQSLSLPKLTASEELRTQICSNQFCQCIRRDHKLDLIQDIIRTRLVQNAQQIQQNHLEREARDILASLDTIVDQSKRGIPRVQLIHAPVFLRGHPKPAPMHPVLTARSPHMVVGGSGTTTTGTITPATAYRDFCRKARRMETNWRYPLVEGSDVRHLSTLPSPAKRQRTSWALGVPQTIDALIGEEAARRRTSETSELSFQSVLGTATTDTAVAAAAAAATPPPHTMDGHEDDLRTHVISVATGTSLPAAAATSPARISYFAQQASVKPVGATP